jgi:diguanylate cyclase
MHSLVATLFYGLTAALIGAAAACWMCRSHFRRKTTVVGNEDARRAAEALSRLQELASRVAFDVDEHNSQVEEINDKLTSTDKHEPAMIVDVVAKLIQTNQQMHEKLASTEDKLRQQAQQIQIHAAEARTDALTLLANRRALDDELNRRIAEFRRQGRVFSLMMADVDDFKKFNDAHGHQVGDEVLRDVAKLLRRKMREMDMVARYGGEEFAIILPGTDLDHSSKTAVRACEAVESHRFRHAGKDLRATASFGVAQVRGNEDGAILVTRADKALYAAKQGGRNCVFEHDGETVRRVGVEAPPVPAGTEVAPPASPEPREPEITKTAGSPSDGSATEAKSDLVRLSDWDTLSNAATRTNFCQQVRARTAEWKRGGPIFSVILIEVNQRPEDGGYPGQLPREAVGLVTTRFLAATVREMDVVGQYAPGCFALLLPTAGLAVAIRVAERLRQDFAQFDLPTQSGQPRLTLSVGVVQVMMDDDSISVLKRAESALDAADRRGGNCVYHHDGERCAPVTAMLEALDYLS